MLISEKNKYFINLFNNTNNPFNAVEWKRATNKQGWMKVYT